MKYFHKKVILYLFLCILSFNGFPQSAIDSLSAALENAAEDTTRVKILNELAFEIGYSDSNKGLLKAQEALALALKIEYDPGILAAKSAIGRLLFDKGDLDSAMFYYAQVLPVFEKQANLYQMFSLYRNIALVHQERLSFKNALHYYNKGREVAEQLGEPRPLGNAYNDLGSFYVFRSFHEKDSLQKVSLLKRSEPYYSKAIGYFEQAGYKRGTALCLGNLASIKLGLKEYDSAMTYSLRALDYFKEKDLNTYITISYGQLSDIYLAKGNLELAKVYSFKCLELSKEMENNFDMRNAYANLSSIFEKEGDYKKSLAYHKLFNKYENEIINKESQGKINELEQKYQSENREQKIKTLSAARSLQELEIKRQNMLLGFSAVVIVLVLILAGILYYSNIKEAKINSVLSVQKEEIAYQNTLLEDKNTMIERQNEEILHKNTKLKQLYDEHRSLVIMVVHDLQSPFNKIKGLSNILGLTGSLNKEQVEIIEKIDQVSENGRHLIADLTSISYLEDENIQAKLKAFRLNYLLKRIQQEHEGYANRKNIQLVLKEVNEEVVVATDRDFFTRIMDNLISNAIKYSPKNKNVYINSGLNNDKYFIEVKDEGPGISEEDQKLLFGKFQKLSARPTDGEHSTGLGLSIVKTLVEKLEGDISVKSKVGEGSSFIVSFPMN